MIENTRWPLDGFRKENKLGLNVKFNLVAIRLKVNAKRLNATFTVI